MPSMLHSPISRRRHLGLCGTVLTGLLLGRRLAAAPAAATREKLPPDPKFQAVYDALASRMRRLYGMCRVKIDGRDLLERSFARVHFSFGLVWNDPQRNTVAFGFYDSIKQTGLVLMTSLVMKRGLERAAALFEKDLPAETIADWQNKAKRIGENLHRLFDESVGGFVGATKVGRGFDVWGNGLAWPLATPAQRAVIAASFAKHRDAIFARGCTRQTPYPDGWPGTQGKGYQNQGYWATGTGFVLPALAEADPDFALRLAQDLVENLDRFKCHEWIDATGKPGGPEDFLASLSMPLMGTRAILTGRPLLDDL